MNSSTCTTPRPRPRPTRDVFASFVVALLIGATPAAADSVTLINTRIAMSGCEIQAIQNAQVFFLDPAGRRQNEPVNEVWAISFDSLPKLDEAEQAIADRDYEAARRLLLEALIATDSPMQRLWIRNRLLRVHGLLEEYAEACAHLADIFILDPDPYWARAQPRCEAVATTYAAVAEAIEALERADRAVKVDAIQQAIDEMMDKLAPLHEELEATYDGPPIEPGTTISGVPRERIGNWNAAPPDAPPPPEAAPAEATDESAGEETNEPNAAPSGTDNSTAAPTQPTAPASPDTPGAIAAHLEAGRYAEALETCRRVSQSLDHRDVGQFLFQFGEALRYTGKPRDASVMYMRAAVLYPASPFAGPSLIETALLYRDTFSRPETARKLLERVAEDAERAERAELAARARTLLSELDASIP